MNTFTKIVGNVGGNYAEKHLVCNDYYNEQEQVQGEFYGKLKEEFNLNKELSKEQRKSFFSRLYNNINPLTNRRITQRELKNKGYDLTLSAPKSISIMCKLGGDTRIKDAFDKALYRTLEHIEKNHLYCRKRAGRNYNTEANIRTGNMLTDIYRHENSRELDPQLHAHAFVFNFTKNPVNGLFKAIDHFEITTKLENSSRFFENELAREIKKLGYDIELTYSETGNVKSFEIVGITEETLDKFSGRSKSIKEVKAEFFKKYGRPPTHEEIQDIKIKTRDRKLIKTNAKNVLKKQYAKLSELEKVQISDLNIAARERSKNLNLNESKENEAINYCLEHLTARKSVLTFDELVTECMKNYCGDIDYKKLEKTIKEREDIIFLSNDKITTLQVKREEEKAIDFVNMTAGTCEAINEDFVAFNDRKSIHNETVKGHDYCEQRKAIREILTSKDQVIIFRGVAGSGKTTSLAELEKGFKDSKTKSFYFAPSTTAVNELKKGVSDNTKTVANLITRYERGLLGKWTNYTERINDSVIVIDEAGLISFKQGSKIMEIAEKYNCRVVLVGDALQHNSVERGDFQRVIEENSNIKKVEIAKIRRQETTDLREIAEDFSKGNMVEGLAKLDEKEFSPYSSIS